MAFTTSYTFKGFTYESAYCKATINNLSANNMTINLAVYANQECRDNGFEPLLVDAIDLPISLESWKGNPIEGTYNAIQDAGMFPDATWNV